MNIFLRELKAHRKSLIIWCIGIIVMVVSGMSKYQALSSTGQTMNDLMSKMPKTLQTIFGTGNLDLSTAVGFYGVLYLYLLIMVTIHASMLGATIISKEEIDKTAEFLFVKPVSRRRIMTSKLIASLANIIIINLVTLVSSLLIVNQYSHGEAVTQPIVTLIVGLFILQILFFFIGTTTAAITNRPKSATAMSTGILLITFMLSVVMDLSGRINWLRFITPFKYFEANQVIYSSGLEWPYVILSLFIIAVLSYITYMLYDKRDINI